MPFRSPIILAFSLAMTVGCAGVAVDPAPSDATSTPAPNSQAATSRPPEASVTDAPVPLEGYEVAIRHGSAPQQFGRLAVPAGAGTHPVVVLIHGGFWRNLYELDLMDDLAADLVARGYAVWNIEYRRVGDDGGGYPGTLLDIAAAIDELAGFDVVNRLDLERVAVVGHSAGGHLALWAMGRDLLPDGAPGASPRVFPTLAIGLAPVVDLAVAAEEAIGSGAVPDLLGGLPAEVPEHYVVAQPPLKAIAGRSLIVHGDMDDIVPIRHSLDHSGEIRVIVVPGADHFDVIDQSHPSWDHVVEALDTL